MADNHYFANMYRIVGAFYRKIKQIMLHFFKSMNSAKQFVNI